MQIRAGRVQVGGLTRVVAWVVQHRIVNGQRGHHRVGIHSFAAYHFGTLAIVQHPFVVLIPEYVIWIPDALSYHALQAHRTTFHHVDIRLSHDFDLWNWKIIHRYRLRNSIINLGTHYSLYPNHIDFNVQNLFVYMPVNSYVIFFFVS